MSGLSRNKAGPAPPDKVVWPRGTDEETVNYVYHGRLENLPKPRSKVVRIFLSSTFSDTKVERNMLMKKVYPEIRQYCRENYDIDFQVVDMRWGVRQEASVDHSASELCMKEIASCNELSVGPTFVTFLSHRYGYRPLPVRVKQDEMDLLLNEIKSQSEADFDLVRQWYQLDENAIPPEYILKPLVSFEYIDELFGVDDDLNEDSHSDEENSDDQHLRKKKQQENNAKYKELLSCGKKEFAKAEPKLKEILGRIASQCVENGKITTEQGLKYTISVTEEEVINGLCKNEKRRDCCLAFTRQIDNINLAHKDAYRFIDMSNDPVDSESQALLTKLRDETLSAYLPEENVFRFQTSWSDDRGINEVDHATYLDDFCQTFKAALIDKIDSAMSTPRITNDPAFSEILEHNQQCVSKVERFVGRENILDKIKDYTLNDCKEPLVLWGESGSGKTSVLAKAAQLAPEWLGDTENLIVVVRFLGTTPDSSTIYKSLASISRQLIKICKFEEMFDIPESFVDLKSQFIELLATIPREKKAVIFLDSLDQLEENSDAYELLWLPSVLPPNVKILLSVLPESQNMLTLLQTKLSDKKQIIEVENLAEDKSKHVIEEWLKLKSRTLTNQQRNCIAPLINRSVKPLYLKLIFDEISTWTSYQIPNFTCDTIQSCILRLFRKVEAQHGKVLVTRALGYLSLSTNGLTELELEDLLALDDDVLNDVFEFHVPPVLRLPSILWARIRRDLEEYIVDREADGTKVMVWYHRQFIEQASHRLLGVGNKTQYHKRNRPLYLTMRDYFGGMWSGNKPKPFVGKRNHDGSKVRYVAPQPVLFRDKHGAIDVENPRYNLRKLSELPAMCTKIGSREDFEFYVRYVLFDAEFLTSWVKQNSLAALDKMADIDLSHYRDSPDEMETFSKREKDVREQYKLIYKCFLMSGSYMLQNSSSLIADFVGRLLIYKDSLPEIQKWIDYCDTKGRELCALVPPHLQLETPGSELYFVINNHDSPVTDVFTSNESYLISVSRKLVVFSADDITLVCDTRPRNVPFSDKFKKVISVGDEICAVLDVHPWVYFFKPTGEVTELIKLENEIGDSSNKTFSISEVRKMDSVSIAIYTTSGSAPLFVINNKKVRLLPVKTQETVRNIFINRKDIFIIEDTSQVWRHDTQTGSTAKHMKYELPITSVYCSKLDDDKHDVPHMSLSLSDGTIILTDFMKFNFTFNDNHYGQSHYLFCSMSEKTKHFAVAACTRTHLLYLTPPIDAITKGDGESAKQDSLKLQFRIRKQYHLVSIAADHSVLFAAQDGQVDLFKLSSEEACIVGKYYSGFSAHGQHISYIEGDGTGFITASKDQSVKMWNTKKVGTTQKYIPNFDSTESSPSQIIPNDDTVFTMGKSRKGQMFLEEWDAVTGRKTRKFQHDLAGEELVALCYDTTYHRLIGIDRQGVLLIWRETKTPLVSKLEPRSHSIDEERQGIEVKVPDITLPTALDMTSAADVKIIAFRGCVVILMESDSTHVMYHVSLDPLQVTKVNNLPVKIKSVHVVENECLVLIPDSDILTDKLTIYMMYSNDIDIQKFDISLPCPTKQLVSSTFRDKVFITSASALLVFDPIKKNTSSFTFSRIKEPIALISESNSGIVYCKEKNIYHTLEYGTDSIRVDELTQYSLTKDIEHITSLAITHDGKYILCIVNQRIIRLLRREHGKLLALYTMFDMVETVAISKNNWYVLLGTSNRRFFVLLIADPNEREHDERIKYVRTMNPGLSFEKATAFMEGANPNLLLQVKPDDDFLTMLKKYREAEARLEKMAKRDPNFQKCFAADEYSDTGEDERSSRSTTSCSAREEHITTPIIDAEYPATQENTSYDPFTQILTRENTAESLLEKSLQQNTNGGATYQQSRCCSLM